MSILSSSSGAGSSSFLGSRYATEYANVWSSTSKGPMLQLHHCSFKSETCPSINLQTAKQIRFSLEWILKNHDDVKQQYGEFVDLGNLEQAPRTSIFIHYSPHHSVSTESTTTKFRVVFYASSKSTNGKSLNDCLHL